MKTKSTRNVLLFLLAFLAIGAIYGGEPSIISPSGELLGMPLSILGNSPFKNFIVPGIILFLVLGLVPIILMVALIKKPEYKFAERINFYKDMHWSWTFSIYVAFALIIWIQIEIACLAVGRDFALHLAFVAANLREKI